MKPGVEHFHLLHDSLLWQGQGFRAHIRARGGRFFSFLSLYFSLFRPSPYTDTFMKAYTLGHANTFEIRPRHVDETGVDSG